MQVSIACTEHNLKSRNGEDRLLSKQSSTAPNVVNAARAKFRTVAIIGRSLGTFTPQHHISLKESTAKQTGMKYRYGCHSLSLCPGFRGLYRGLQSDLFMLGGLT
jgi:potassium voltage-gated channel Shaker-related subfamily A beta protein 1